MTSASRASFSSAAPSSALRLAAVAARLSPISCQTTGASPSRLAERLEAVAILSQQLALGAVLQPADGGNDEAHGTRSGRRGTAPASPRASRTPALVRGAVGSLGRSADHIFSRL